MEADSSDENQCTDRGSRGLRRASRVSFALCFGLGLVFAANLLLGKAKIAFGWTAPDVLSDIAEFLLLLATALFFALTALLKERLHALEREGQASK